MSPGAGDGHAPSHRSSPPYRTFPDLATVVAAETAVPALVRARIAA